MRRTLFAAALAVIVIGAILIGRRHATPSPLTPQETREVIAAISQIAPGSPRQRQCSDDSQRDRDTMRSLELGSFAGTDFPTVSTKGAHLSEAIGEATVPDGQAD